MIIWCKIQVIINPFLKVRQQIIKNHECLVDVKNIDFNDDYQNEQALKLNHMPHTHTHTYTSTL